MSPSSLPLVFPCFGRSIGELSQKLLIKDCPMLLGAFQTNHLIRNVEVILHGVLVEYFLGGNDVCRGVMRMMLYRLSYRVELFMIFVLQPKMYTLKCAPLISVSQPLTMKVLQLKSSDMMISVALSG